MSAPAPSVTPPPASNNTSPPPAASASPPPPAAPVPVAAPPPPQAQAPPPATPVNPTPPVTTPPPDGGSPSPPAPPVSPSPPAGGSPPSRGGTPPSVPSPPPPASGSNTPRGSAPPRTPSTPTPRPPSSDNSGGGGGGGGISTTAIIGIAAAGALILIVLAIVLFCMRRKPKRKYRRDEDYESGHYKGGMYEAGRRPSHYGPSHPPPPPPPPPHKHHHAYGSPTPPPPPPPPPPHYSSSGSHDSWTPVPPPPPPRAPSAPSSLGSSKSWFTYEELEEATNGFSRANLLGEGGFGCVYKGCLPNGKVVAVKQLKVGSGQGEREFRAEVEIISRVHHRHLVSLVGYCIADTQRILVYDFVPNGTLEHHMHGRGRPVMPWPTRLKIAAGAARGLAYLHEDCHPRIIHRDIKSSNILLDNNFEAQVSDFGLAKLASDTYTHVTTRVMGTFGYLAPEYASSGKLTEKSDVYSFGVVLLELITGRKPVDTTQPVGDESLVEWARPYLTQALDDGNLDDLVDRRLGNYNESEMLRMVQAAAACVRHSANKRPRMAQVVRALENEVADLTQGLKPGHSSNFGSSDYDTNQYASDMRKFRKLALGSQEHDSGTTSEYGMNPSGSSSEGLMSSTEIDRRRQQGQQQGSDEINVTPGLYGR